MFESISNDENRAVSPVIGVILMVAVTVILAAVIAAMMTGLGPGEPDPTAGAQINEDGNTVTVSWISEGDNDGTLYVAHNTSSPDIDSVSSSNQITNVGGSIEISNPDNITVLAERDGKVGVIENWESDD